MSSGKANFLFREIISHLAGNMPFDRVCEHIKLATGRKISQTLVRKTAEKDGKIIMEMEEDLADNLQEEINNEKESVEIQANKEKQRRSERVYIEADGSFVPIRANKANGEKGTQYKENKLGIFFKESDLKKSEKKKSQIVKKYFVSSLGKGVKHFEKLLLKKAYELKTLFAKEIIFISDGAEWIDQMRERLFPQSIHILDWYHAVEHLYTSAKKIFGEKNQKKIEEWVKPLKDLLWAGQTTQVCDILKFEARKKKKHQTVITELRNYYISRIDKMKYDVFREKGYYIGSGAIESANKYLVKDRLKLSGMSWVIDGASAIIHLRQKMYEKDWDMVKNYRKLHFSYG